MVKSLKALKAFATLSLLVTTQVACVSRPPSVTQCTEAFETIKETLVSVAIDTMTQDDNPFSVMLVPVAVETVKLMADNEKDTWLKTCSDFKSKQELDKYMADADKVLKALASES